MRISKVHFINYRQLKNIEIELRKTKNNDLHLIIAQNSTCKTNILNGINWCFYGDEPHLSGKSEGLPIINVDTAKKDGKHNVEVSIMLEDLNDKKVVLKRVQIYETKEGSVKSKQPSSLEIIITDDTGSSKVISGNDANEKVERLIPKNIREYFFFDGEKLDNYLDENVRCENIKNAILKLSCIKLIDDTYFKLNNVHKDLRKESSKGMPDLTDKIKTIEEKEKMINDTTKNKELLQVEKRRADQQIDKLLEILKSCPDTNKLSEKRKQYENIINDFKIRLKEKELKKRNYLFGISKIVFPYNAIKETRNMIKTKIEKKEIPPSIDKSVLEKSIEDCKCALCGGNLNGVNLLNVKELLDKNQHSDVIIRGLLEINHYLESEYEKIIDYKKNITDLNLDMESLHNDIRTNSGYIEEIDSELRGYDVGKIGEDWRKYERFKEAADKTAEKIGSISNQIENYKIQLEKLNNEYKRNLLVHEKQKEIGKKILFCERAQNVLQDLRNEILNKVRISVQEKTKDTFLKLIWRKNTYDQITIDKEYNIHLSTKDNKECLGTVSAAEKELLTLSFTIALHKLSGFSAPLLIDTPVARTSDVVRRNFGIVFDSVSKDKQTILLLTPSEYKDEIEEKLSPIASNIFKPQLNESESQLILGV